MQTNYALFSERSQPLIKTLDQISVWSGKTFGWLIVPMVICLVYEVFARYLFNAPTLWAYDMTYMLYGTHFMLGAAFTLAVQGHIRTDFFYRLWPVRWQGAVDSLLYLCFFFPALALWFWAGLDYAAVSWERGEVAISSPWKPIIYPFKAVMPITTVLLMLQGLAELAKCLYAARHGVWPLIDDHMNDGEQI